MRAHPPPLSSGATRLVFIVVPLSAVSTNHPICKALSPSCWSLNIFFWLIYLCVLLACLSVRPPVHHWSSLLVVITPSSPARSKSWLPKFLPIVVVLVVIAPRAPYLPPSLGSLMVSYPRRDILFKGGCVHSPPLDPPFFRSTRASLYIISFSTFIILVIRVLSFFFFIYPP
jgi:hypothetical protein